MSYKISINKLDKRSDASLLLETRIGEVKAGKNTKFALESISRMLKQEHNMKTMNVSIVKNNGKFFGANIYPSTSIADDLIKVLIHPKDNREDAYDVWARCDEWTIELDSKIFETTLNLNPGEIVAIIQHEIGHMIYSNTIPQRLNKVIKYEILKMEIKYRRMLTKGVMSELLHIPLLGVFSVTNFIPSPNEMAKELDADRYARSVGYGNELNIALEKILMVYGNSSISRNHSDIDNELKVISKWTLENLAFLEMRKTKLKKNLELELELNPSKYAKGVFKKMHTNFFGANNYNNRYNGNDGYVLKESFLPVCNLKIVNESIMDKIRITKKIKKITITDVYAIRVDMEKIESTDDKIYVLDKISSLIEDLDTAITMCENGRCDKVSQTVQSLKAVKKEADLLHTEVLKLKVVPKKYGLFIRYPDGFEG